jgi:hypothetical protein
LEHVADEPLARGPAVFQQTKPNKAFGRGDYGLYILTAVSNQAGARPFRLYIHHYAEHGDKGFTAGSRIAATRISHQKQRIELRLIATI